VPACPGQLVGWSSALGWKAYLSMALARQTVGLDIRHNEIRVWFFDVLLGAFDPRTQETVEPIPAAESA
jgi:hypothetical protein